jgi:hypothetical protein
MLSIFFKLITHWPTSSRITDDGFTEYCAPSNPSTGMHIHHSSLQSNLTEGQGFLYWASWCIYALFYHPAAKFAGPKLAAISEVKPYQNLQPLRGIAY